MLCLCVCNLIGLVDYIILSVDSSNSILRDGIYLSAWNSLQDTRARVYLHVNMRACVCARSCVFQMRKISYMFSVSDYNLFCN